MNLLEIIFLLVIAGLAGSIGQSFAGYSKGGCILSIVVGFIGALIGTWLARGLNLPDLFVINIGTVDFPIIWSILGAFIFTFILGLLSPKKRRK